MALAASLAAQANAFDEGRRRYEAGQYQQAVEAFAAAVRAEPADSEGHHWLGKAYGRLAERSPWYRAFLLARKAGEELERAVALDPRNEAAVASLLRFYEEAPAVVGGGSEKAERLRERLRGMGLAPAP